MLWLIYWEDIRIGEVVRLEPQDWDRGRGRLTLPPRRNAARTREGRKRKTVTLSASSTSRLEHWWALRARLGAASGGPLFCHTRRTDTAFAVSQDGLRQSLRMAGRELGLEKRLSSEGLRLSGRHHRRDQLAGVEGQLASYLHEDRIHAAHPEAFACLQSARSLCDRAPEKDATAIGHACRESLLHFARDLTISAGIEESQEFHGSIDRLRAVIQQLTPSSKTVRTHLNALLAYWGTTFDLANRQEHGVTKAGGALTAEDARRLVFHTMVVMYEWHRAVDIGAQRALASHAVGARGAARTL